jgi:CDP-glycerol glycerophosphotransferase (TagB/SpsB family)
VLLNASLRQHPLMTLGTDAVAVEAIRDAKARGLRLVLYAPTFRKDFADPFDGGVIDLAELCRLGEETRTFFLVKLHPCMKRPRVGGYDPRFVCIADPDSDIYPSLAIVDVLVTDYSSIFFDYLLLGRPIVFFCHDLDSYLASDRGFYFDYAMMTPGPKVRLQTELQDELRRLAGGDDAWVAERARVRALVFDHPKGSAVMRLLKHIGLSQ